MVTNIMKQFDDCRALSPLLPPPASEACVRGMGGYGGVILFGLTMISYTYVTCSADLGVDHAILV